MEEYLALLKSSLKRAFGGGLAGASAMVIQVISLMWMRTIMNYQYRHGTSFKQAASKLYAEGGIPRFYKGILPGLLQGPLSRFGDTASNAGMLAFLNSIDSLQQLPTTQRTMIMTSAASAAAGCFRIFLMPIDTFKTVLQVEGSRGIPTIMNKYRQHGLPVFYHGSLAAATATFAGYVFFLLLSFVEHCLASSCFLLFFHVLSLHSFPSYFLPSSHHFTSSPSPSPTPQSSHFPWFFVYNTLNEKIPQKPDDQLYTLCRSAGMGFTASVVSDTTSNSIRVIKTYRQTHAENISYPRAVKDVIAKDGVIGLFGRGLKTRLLANGIQGLMFSVLWTHFSKKLDHKITKDEQKTA